MVHPNRPDDQASSGIRGVQSLDLHVVLDQGGAITVYSIEGAPTGPFHLTAVPEYDPDGSLAAVNLHLECRLDRPDFDIASEADDPDFRPRPALFLLPDA